MVIKPKVFVTRKIPDSGIKLLKKTCQVKVYQKDTPISKKELEKGASWADAILTLLTEKITADFIQKNSHLRVISNYAVGFDNIDLTAASQNNIVVTNTPGVLTDSVAEFSLALMLSISKRIVEADKFCRAKKYHSWQPMLFLGPQLRGKTLGIVGSGRIGSDLALKCYLAFGMKIIYLDDHRNDALEISTSAKKVTLRTLCKKSDFMSLHVPLTKKTKHLISKDQLSLMKKSAILINTARGQVVDELALFSFLKQKKIAGAALDVFEFEPKIASGLEKLDNVILTPHIASATVEAREQMSLIAAKNILAVLNGKKVLNQVNK